MQETQVRSLGWEDPLEKEMATHSSILAWRIPWIEEPCGLQSTGSQSWTQLSDFKKKWGGIMVKITKNNFLTFPYPPVLTWSPQMGLCLQVSVSLVFVTGVSVL